MPHIELKTSAGALDERAVLALLRALTERLSGFETVSPSAIKAYNSPISTWVMGDGAPGAFVHCVVSVLKGRPIELRRRMADELVGIMRDSVAQGEISVTLELREMEPETYRK